MPYKSSYESEASPKEKPTPSEIEKKAKILKDLLISYEGKYAEVSVSSGFIHYKTKKNRLLMGNRKIDYPLSKKYHGQKYDNHQFQLAEDLLGSEEDSKIANAILNQEYKFHLMPKPEYMIYVVDEILKRASEDKEFASLISGLKISIRPNTIFAQPAGKHLYYPNIVIYPKLGTKNAQKVLNILRELFSKNADLLGEDKLPRGSEKVDNLIYYAVGGYDLKYHLVKKSLGKLDYDDMKAKFFVPGGKHLKGSTLLDIRTSAPASKASDLERKARDEKEKGEEPKHKDKNKEVKHQKMRSHAPKVGSLYELARKKSLEVEAAQTQLKYQNSDPKAILASVSQEGSYFFFELRKPSFFDFDVTDDQESYQRKFKHYKSSIKGYGGKLVPGIPKDDSVSYIISSADNGEKILTELLNYENESSKSKDESFLQKAKAGIKKRF